MINKTKRQKKLKELVDKKQEYLLKDAIAIIKKSPKTKFDQTVEISMKLGLEQSSDQVRGMVNLPHGTGKSVKVLVFCKGEKEKEAKESGADYVGSDDLVKKIEQGWFDFDVAVTTPDMMKEIAKLGKMLGPKGLMPNPKTGTVTNEIEKIVKELKAGKIEYKMDKQSEVKAAVGKVSFQENMIEENIFSFVNAVLKSNTKLQKVQNFKAISISSTMGVGIKLDRSQFKQI